MGGLLSPSRAALVAALAGCACMVVELSAVRMLAPFFGDSAYVWTNVIGVILLALALGAWTGGIWAERIGLAAPRRLLVAASLVLAVVPFFAPILGDWLLPQDLPLDAAMPALIRGSLAASVVLFGPPLWLLGAVAPGLVVGVANAGNGLGRSAGLVSATGTMGSLVGTFVTTHWLVPEFGCRAAIWASAGLLAIAGCATRARGMSVASLLIAVTCLGLPLGPLRAAPAGSELLAEVESRHQYLRVLRSRSEDGSARTELKINEGLDSYHSVAIEGRRMTSSANASLRPSSYYDYHAIAPWLAGDGSAPTGLRALSIGDAAGTFRRCYAAAWPDAVVDAVELDPAVVRLGERWFDAPVGSGTVVGGLDGRVFVERARTTWHCIHVDAYSHHVYIPAHLASLEFFTAARARLEQKGVLACNVGGLGIDDPVVTAIAHTMRAVFDDVAALRIPDSRNVLLLGRRDAQLASASLPDAVPPVAGMSEVEHGIWSRVVAEAKAARWGKFATDAGASIPLRDDRPALDGLLLASYVQNKDPGEPLGFSGPNSAEWAEAAAFERYSEGDFPGVIAAAKSSVKATPYLCYLAGAANWALRRIQSARMATQDGVAMAPAEPLLGSLRAQGDALDAEWQPIARAMGIAERNGILAAALACCGAAFALLAGYRMSRMPAAPSVSVSTAAR
jgi:spermidine synthase